MKVFEKMHPLPIFVYMVAVVTTTMLTLNPIIFAISFVGSWLFCLVIAKPKLAVDGLIFYIPMLILIAFSNPFFSHNGITVLFWVGDRPFTLESLLYGCAIGGMLISILMWLKDYNMVMSSSKSICLFAKVAPKVGLVVSMALRFVPLFVDRLKKVKQTQKTLGLFCSEKYFVNIKNHLQVFFSVFAWAIENAIDTADSMSARGYIGNKKNKFKASGTHKRRAVFSIFRFGARDALFLSFAIICFGAIIALAICGQLEFSFYPYMTTLYSGAWSAVTYAVCAIMMTMPFFVEVKEMIKWKFLQSKI
ncbi:MAG: energy-coupling factor transporter transmembrane component T [Clostridia bacterium]